MIQFFFIQKDYSKGGIESYQGFKHKISNLIYKHFNYCIDKVEFSNDLKHVDIVPVYKKNNKCEKERIIDL